METKRIILSLYVVFTSALWVNAQESTHWQCDIYDYEYDMAIYFELKQGEEAISDLTDYEVAAFVGEECRGVAEVQTVTTDANSNVQYGYLRIHSNQKEDESINFRAYQLSTGNTINIKEIISFKNLDLIGMPSTPSALTTSAKKGDVNYDGSVDASDIVEITNYIMGKQSKKFDKDAADMNNDNIVNIADIIMVANIILTAN